jgi:hypothetical protein
MPIEVVPDGKKCAEEGPFLPGNNTPPQISRRNASPHLSAFPRIRILLNPERNFSTGKDLISLFFEGLLPFLVLSIYKFDDEFIHS